LKRRSEGAALLAVLWLSAALSAIAFSVAATVRGETERAATSVDDIKSYYLATGSIQRAILYFQWGPQFYRPGTSTIALRFPSGEAVVEIVPETAKLNINAALPEDLYKLLLALGANGSQASELTSAIVDWRTPAPDNKLSPFDAFYLSLSPSFRSPHASFQEIEELLSIKGMTPDLFYGTYVRERDRLVATGGLRDCVSTHGTTGSFEINTASPALLLAAGLAPDQVAALVARRAQQPFGSPEEARAFASGLGPAGERLRLGGNTMFTFRATVRLRLQNGQLSDMQRTVAALIKFMPSGSDATFHVIRWYDRD